MSRVTPVWTTMLVTEAGREAGVWGKMMGLTAIIINVEKSSSQTCRLEAVGHMWK